jgi:hypothetical protein
MRRLLPILLLSCSARPDVTVEKIEVNVDDLPPVTINPVITLPAACDAGADEPPDAGGPD